LCYHAVSDTLDCELAVTENQLRMQMRVLVERGYSSVTLSDLEQKRIAGEDVSQLVAVTFDDGYHSMTRAEAILHEVGFVATVFVLPPTIGSQRPLRWPGIEVWADGPKSDELVPLSWDQLDALRHGGWEVGAHTMTHPKLPQVSDDQLVSELEQSRSLLVARYGDCHAIAYPYGLANRHVAAAAAAAGFTTGTTLSAWHRTDEPLLRPRVGIYLHDHERRFRAKIAPWSRGLRSVPATLKRSRPPS
ncbi:MAG: polysaccharide deacetylase family protein, partial [Thermoleophilaceae bacterium]|nr:polysaccharide deacetylase family protein [Thermoleophilaceae bacterium]